MNGALIIGIGFLLIAILDGTGSQAHIRKKYREKEGISEWQKKRVIADILVSLGSITMFFAAQKAKMIYFVGLVVTLIGFIVLVAWDCKFKNKKAP